MELLNSMSKRGVLFGVLIPACGVSVHHTHETSPEHPPASAVLAAGERPGPTRGYRPGLPGAQSTALGAARGKIRQGVIWS